MSSAFLITLREGLEAALIVGIILGYLERINRTTAARYVWYGVFLAIAASIAVAAGIQFLGVKLTGRAEEIFEGAMMFLAVGLLTWVIFWMRYHAITLKSTLEKKVQYAVGLKGHWGLVSVAFIAVFREGIESVLFLSAAAFADEGGGVLLGALIGIMVAVLAGYGILVSTARLNIRWVFNFTSVLLLFFAAGLLAHGIHELQEAGVISSFNEHLWDTNSFLDENSVLGELMKALFGYNGNPSIEEVIAYLSYWVAALLGLRWWMEKKAGKLDHAAA
jgi:high-affinity iron transporter